MLGCVWKVYRGYRTARFSWSTGKGKFAVGYAQGYDLPTARQKCIDIGKDETPTTNGCSAIFCNRKDNNWGECVLTASSEMYYFGGLSSAHIRDCPAQRQASSSEGPAWAAFAPAAARAALAPVAVRGGNPGKWKCYAFTRADQAQSYYRTHGQKAFCQLDPYKRWTAGIKLRFMNEFYPGCGTCSCCSC